MAGTDYLKCSNCSDKMLYDGNGNIRLFLTEKYGKKYEILCPYCVKRLNKKLEKRGKK